MILLPRNRSLRWRLGVQLVASAAVLAIVLILLFQSFARQIAEESLDNVLLASATSILEGVTVRDAQIEIDIPYAAMSMLGSVSDDRVFYRIDGAGGILTGYETLPASTLTATTPQFGSATFNTFQVRTVTLSKSISLSGRTERVAVTLAQTQEGLADRLNNLFIQAMGLGMGFFAVATALALWVVSRAFLPLQTLAQSVERRGPSDLRPFRTDVPVEMSPLVTALNGFTTRLVRALTRSEDFIAEAAHRVRTPLATVRTQAEVILRRVDKEENRVAMKQMIRAVDESSRAAGQLLDQAMVNLRTDALEQADVDVADCVSDVVDRLNPVASLRDIDLVKSVAATAPIPGDVILIQNAVTNLLDNAIKYAPSETTVSVTVTDTPAGAQITIRDQGPGFGEKDPTRLLDRFVRGDASDGTVGSGLGLTIADQVFVAHGGRLTLTNNETGEGACVTAYLPR
jgi:two-component system sensor histidine kinase TctE